MLQMFLCFLLLLLGNFHVTALRHTGRVVILLSGCWLPYQEPVSERSYLLVWSLDLYLDRS